MSKGDCELELTTDAVTDATRQDGRGDVTLVVTVEGRAATSRRSCRMTGQHKISVGSLSWAEGLDGADLVRPSRPRSRSSRR